ncbi:DUF397 domain-containing protein [Streptomyces prunicolor]|uniref:DUF397 domain-containing protein n=1 Tax=Streptomyces prunicolor TaxID=67348 RepID=UPI0003688DCA|nr:DUF397 domain-containing protein [Streptomyces prunicolor]
MTSTLDLSSAAWRKSSYSDGGANNCVEVADSYPGLVSGRDSKTPAGPPLILAAATWSGFVDGVKAEAGVLTFG